MLGLLSGNKINWMLCTCEKKKKNKKFDTKHFNNNKIKISVLIKKKSDSSAPLCFEVQLTERLLITFAC